MVPPKTTDRTTPISFAVSPLSNCPNSLLDIMKIELTLKTRPRISSGVFSWTIVPRITTLIPSSIPLRTRNANDSQYIFDNPNPMIQSPKPVATKSRIFPWFFFSGTNESVMIISIEPISEAAFKSPKPSEPTFRISLAKTGIIATAPPNSTANISSICAPRISLVL